MLATSFTLKGHLFFLATTKALGGGTVGALVGLVPAVFTLGLSIPIGIAAWGQRVRAEGWKEVDGC